MKCYSHIRSKSDTDFQHNKNSLDITHYNLKLFREEYKSDSSNSKRKTSSNSHYLLPRQNSNLIATRKKYFSNQFKNQNQVENFEVFFNNYLIKVVRFKKKYDQIIFDRYINNQKFFLNILLTFILQQIKQIKDNSKNNIELLKKIEVFEQVVYAIITIRPEEYYHELKSMILNEFEKWRYNLSKVLDESKEAQKAGNLSDDLGKKIVALSQAVLFILSKISYQLDYYSLTMNCLVQKMKAYIIIFIDYIGQEKGKFISPSEKNRRLKTMHLVEHIIYLDKIFTEEFYSENSDSTKNLLQLNVFSSFGRYILNNLLQVCGKCDQLKLPQVIKRNCPFGLVKHNKILYNYTIKYFVNKGLLKEKNEFKTKLEKFFRMHFNLKLVSWKNGSIKIENSKKKTEICRICELKIPITDFFFHINYCKEQKVFYELVKNINENMAKPISDLEAIINSLNGKNDFILSQKNINKKKIDFESLKIPKNEEIKKNYSYFYKLPCFAFLVDKKEKHSSQTNDKFLQLLELYSFETEIPIDFYEKNPKQIPFLFSLIYLSFYIFYINCIAKVFVPEINQIFSEFLHYLLRKLIGIEYLIGILKCKTKSNCDFRNSKTFQKFNINEFKNSSPQKGNKKEDENEFPFILKTFKSKINCMNSYNFHSSPIHRTLNSKISSNTVNSSNRASNNEEDFKGINLFQRNNSNNPNNCSIKRNLLKNKNPFLCQKENKVNDLARKLFMFESEELKKSRTIYCQQKKVQPFILKSSKKSSNSSIKNKEPKTCSDTPPMGEISLEQKPRKSLFGNNPFPFENIISPKKRKASQLPDDVNFCFTKKIKNSSSDESLSINYDEDSIIITSPKMQPQDHPIHNLKGVEIGGESDSEESSDESDSMEDEQFQSNSIKIIFTELVNNMNYWKKEIEIDTESSSSSSEVLGHSENFTLQKLDQPRRHSKHCFSLSSELEAIKPSISDFQFLIPIAKGGYGRVDIYKKKTTGDLFAIKTVDISSMKEKNFSSTLKNETIILNEINSDFCVKCYYIFKDDINYYYVMEYMPGGDLLGLLNANDIYQQTIQFIIAEVLLAINYLHSMNILHKDIKPENILISKQGHFKLSDFGLSESEMKFNKYSILEVGDNNELAQMETTVQDKKIFGTLNYMAPEMFTNNYEITFAVDYWALGVLIFELYTNKVPFYDTNPKKIKNNIINLKINWSVLDNKENHSKFDNLDDAIDLIKKFLVIDPEKRWGNHNFDEIKGHKLFSNFNWSEIKSIVIGEVLLHVKTNMQNVNDKIKAMPKQAKAPKDVAKTPIIKTQEKPKEGSIAENFEEIQYIKRGRVNSENFYCKRVDNLYGKSKDVINTQIKLNNVKMNEDNTGSIFDDLK